MKNCLILGSGRSGTSMAAGMLRNSGCYLGDDYIAPRAANPKGFFEDSEVNRINEDIMVHNLRRRWRYRLQTWLGRGIPPYAHWLAVLPADLELRPAPGAAQRIVERVSHAPFCFKDPRFCYTLPVWRPYLPDDTRLLVVFRSPEATARSILREWKETVYFSSLRLDEARAMEVWRCCYRRILSTMSGFDCWFFTHYDRLVDGTSWRAIEAFLQTRIDREFPDAAISRTRKGADEPGARRHEAVYDKLLELERASLVNWSGRPSAAA